MKISKKYLFSAIFYSISSLVASITFAQPSAQSTYLYRIDWFQAKDADCPAAASAIAANFTKATGFSVLSSGCERPFSWKQDVVIQYRAETPASLVSTYYEFAQEQGTYLNKETCEADLLNEKTLFEQKTGLPAVSAFCFPESSNNSENLFPFIARIDGFGTTTKRPFVFDAHIYATPESPRELLEQSIIDSLRQMPWIETPRIRVDYTGAIPRAVIKYYATKERGLTLDSIASFEKIDDCRQGQARFNTLLNEYGVVGAKSFCTQEQFSETAVLYYFGLTAGAYSQEKVPGSFLSRAQCEEALPNIIAQYTAATGSNLVKGFCSYEKLELLSNNAFIAKVLIAN